MKASLRIFVSLVLLFAPLTVYADSEICRMNNGFLDQNGIGGTGQEARSDDGKGIGGTGYKFDTAYVTGTLYKFGSICVNGLRISYEPDQFKDLRIGQVVEVRAVKDGVRGVMRAEDVRVSYAVTGAVTGIDRDRGMMFVDQKPVFVSLASSVLSAIQEGDFVRVSGFKDRAGTIVASLVLPASGVLDGDVLDFKPEPGSYVSLEGYLDEVGPGKRVVLDGKTLNVFDMSCGGEPLENGERVIAMGQVQADGRLLVGGFADADIPVTRMGYPQGNGRHRYNK
ncbi:MAG: DUF5666 domain-containing protein [Alphaproteobacteria bacterium]